MNPEVQENKLRPFQHRQQPFQYGHQWLGWHCTILLSIKSTYFNISKEINMNNVSFNNSCRYLSRWINRPNRKFSHHLQPCWCSNNGLITVQQVQCGLNELIVDSSHRCCTIKTFEHVVVDSNVITLASSSIPSAEEEKEWNYGGVMQVDVSVLYCADCLMSQCNLKHSICSLGGAAGALYVAHINTCSRRKLWDVSFFMIAILTQPFFDWRTTLSSTCAILNGGVRSQEQVQSIQHLTFCNVNQTAPVSAEHPSA